MLKDSLCLCPLVNHHGKALRQCCDRLGIVLITSHSGEEIAHLAERSLHQDDQESSYQNDDPVQFPESLSISSEQLCTKKAKLTTRADCNDSAILAKSSPPVVRTEQLHEFGCRVDFHEGSSALCSQRLFQSRGIFLHLDSTGTSHNIKEPQIVQNESARDKDDARVGRD